MKNPTRPLFWIAPCVAAGLLFSGCVGALPRPVSGKVERGHKLTPAEVAFIQPGITTHADVTNRLGTSYVSLPQERAIAYSWELKGGGWLWWWSFGGPSVAAADRGTVEGGWRGYFIAFDSERTVTRTDFKRLSTRHSLHEHLYKWVEKEPAPETAASAPCSASLK